MFNFHKNNVTDGQTVSQPELRSEIKVL